MKIALVATSSLTFLCVCSLMILTIINAVKPERKRTRHFVKTDAPTGRNG